MKAYAVDIRDKFEPAQSFEDPAGLINRILPNIYLLAGIIAFLLIVGGGFLMIQSASSGDASQAERGKKAATYGIIGLVIIFAAFLIVNFITNLTSGESIF